MTYQELIEERDAVCYAMVEAGDNLNELAQQLEYIDELINEMERANGKEI